MSDIQRAIVIFDENKIEQRERLIEDLFAQSGYLPGEVIIVQKDQGNGIIHFFLEPKIKAVESE